jgi:hypothetical protein
MTWIFSQILCKQIIQDCENSPSLQALAVDCLPVVSLDGEPSAPSNGTTTPVMCLSHGKTTEALKLSRFGQTCKPLTDDLGAELLMSYLAGFPAKTSAQPAKAQASTANAQACGNTLHALLARYDPATASLKTAQCSFLEDLSESSVTLPAWGMTRNGDVYLQPKSARIMGVTESGLWPDGLNYHHTPNTHGMDGGSNSRKALAARQLPWATPTTMDKLPPKSETALMREMTIARPGRSQPANLRDQVSNSRNWVTPTAAMAQHAGRVAWKEGQQISLPQQVNNKCLQPNYPTPCSTDHKGAGQSGDLRDRLDYAVERGGTKSATFEKNAAGQLSPNWVEWLMGWPIGWTDLTAVRLIQPDWKNDPANLPVDHPDYTPRVISKLPHRAARIKCIGNGQVPQCAATAFVILTDQHHAINHHFTKIYPRTNS